MKFCTIYIQFQMSTLFFFHLMGKCRSKKQSKTKSKTRNNHGFTEFNISLSSKMRLVHAQFKQNTYNYSPRCMFRYNSQRSDQSVNYLMVNKPLHGGGPSVVTMPKHFNIQFLVLLLEASSPPERPDWVISQVHRHKIISTTYTLDHCSDSYF